MKHTDLLGFQVLDKNVVRKQIRKIIKEASCRQKSQELADSYSAEELQSRLDQIMRDMEQEAEPEGGPIADMYADEMDAYEGAIRMAKGSSDTPLTYDQAIGRVSRDDFEKSSEFDRGIGEGQKIGKTSYKTRTAVNTAPGKTEDKEIFIDNIDTLDNVTIRWRGANHWGNKTLTNLKFERESEFDDDLIAFSNDSIWGFIVDLDEETGEPDWDTLMINNRELENVADDGTSTYSVPDEDIVEQGFDAGLANAMGMSDDEFEDQVTSRDIEAPFPGTNNVSPFVAKAKDYIDTFRQEYREMSDDGIDEFSVEIINHLLDNTAAQAAAKVFFGKKGLEEYDGGRLRGRQLKHNKEFEPTSISSGNCCVDTYGVGTTMGPIMYGDAMCYNAASTYVGDVSVNNDGSCP